jgi:hypothetical protein
MPSSVSRSRSRSRDFPAERFSGKPLAHISTFGLSAMGGSLPAARTRLSRATIARRIQRRLSEWLPCARIEIAGAWAGTFGESPDGLPWIGRVPGARRVHAARVVENCRNLLERSLGDDGKSAGCAAAGLGTVVALPVAIAELGVRPGIDAGDGTHEGGDDALATTHELAPVRIARPGNLRRIRACPSSCWSTTTPIRSPL